MATVLKIRDLAVTYPDGTQALRGVDLDLAEGECLALAGESGSGKSTLLRVLLSLLPKGSRVTGSAVVDDDGTSLEAVGADRATLRRLRGGLLGYVGQDPHAAADPLWSVGRHLREAWRARRMRPAKGAAEERAEAVGITQARARLRQYPHQWSGGMLQRAHIAGAGVHGPLVTLADEPTSALDAGLAATTLAVLRADARALLLVCHDLRHVAAVADRVAVLYAGRVVETGVDVPARPRHPYTKALVAAAPRPGHGLPEELPGTSPDLRRELTGCAFAPRCGLALESCHREDPVLDDGVACPVVPR
ncbi:oligopeptide/dipeptide ABC transporter ATP-binding protein [Phytomonospora endophytica]|uniref:Oligopeptide/dipeptide ABC transporter ATP-binding protein n=1 Tax=Phytomonospora endophytica TaxID=714109 RepID=A0A841FC78_9ACTN|nr:oligopeptide/dipeptide ABC transporter ATP-binding protein [Phytomonospora endophytica]MBB6034891.1 oligopeptide/dipeptide ABC transporter ATP-binding protein [Phytomonospora endophytica]GIG70595.1 ABC transporter ATP-binding protein [Phytomonospora endophytica]